MEGIKETKEVLVGANELAVLLIESFKDGIQVADAAVILSKVQEPAIMEKLSALYIGVEKVPAEIKDISLLEAVELASAQLSYVPKIVEALQKPA